MPETEKSEHSGSEKAPEDAREDIIRHYETGGRDDANNIGEAEVDIHADGVQEGDDPEEAVPVRPGEILGDLSHLPK